MNAPPDDSLEGLRTIDRADVFKAGRHAGALVRNEDGIEFRYFDAWVEANGPPVATTLPVTSEPVVRVGGALPAYFTGLLPEGRRLGALRRAVKTSADDELSLLLAVGADAVGDVEKFVLDAAHRSGLIVPPHHLVWDADGVPGLLIARFDRATVDGQPQALAVEDGCQVLDRPPADKYRLGADRTFAGLAVLCDASAVAGRDLIRQLAFAYLTGNGDAHAKNFSVLQGLDGEWRIAPAYDLPTSYLYGDRTMALSICGRSGGDFRAADFVALGKPLGVPERAVRRVLTDIAQRADLWLEGLHALPFDKGRLIKLRRVIEYRRRQLAPSPSG